METQVSPRKPYPTDVSDEEWAFVAPYLSLMTAESPQRRHAVREVFDALRWIVHTGAPWRSLPGDFPPWPAVYQQSRRWIAAGVFAEMVHDLREMLRWTAGRTPQPTAVMFDSATRQSTPESGHRAGYDGYKRRKGSKIHAAVDTLGELLALLVTPANAQDRAQVATLAAAVQDVTGGTVQVAFVDQNSAGPTPAAAASVAARSSLMRGEFKSPSRCRSRGASASGTVAAPVRPARAERAQRMRKLNLLDTIDV